jgi:PadR family transcriptional regulator
MAAPAPGPKKVTQPTLQVLELLLSQPKRDDWFGLEICREAGLGSGTVTQILVRLDQWGWVATRWEDEDQAHAHGRPRRRFYRLNAVGQCAARELLLKRPSGLAASRPHGRAI